MTLTIAIISDTHAHLDKRIEKLISKCNYAIHAGDICGEHVIESMNPLDGKVFVVTGNNDPYCHKTPLPEIINIDLPGGILTVEHGHKHGHHKPDHDSLRKMHTDSRIVVYGHTHKQLIDKTEEPWIINPGAAGQTRNHGGPSCLVLEVSEDSWEVTPYRFSDETVKHDKAAS